MKKREKIFTFDIKHSFYNLLFDNFENWIKTAQSNAHEVF